jgi:hypothetical protein
MVTLITATCPPTARRIAGLLRPFTLYDLRKLPQRTRGPIACGQQSEGHTENPKSDEDHRGLRSPPAVEPCCRRQRRAESGRVRRHHPQNGTLNKDAPVSRPVQRTGVISSRAILGGLHHRYARD